jgi:hypothetical protein
MWREKDQRKTLFGISWGGTRRYDTHGLFDFPLFLRLCCYYDLDDAFLHIHQRPLRSVLYLDMAR